MILLILWYIISGIQGLMSYGTVYRLTKRGSDNGVALFGWFIAFGFVSLIPGLGIYLWFKYKDPVD